MSADLTRAGLRPGPSLRSVRDADGNVLDVPAGWDLLPPGDAGLTRAVKGMGPTWAVEEKRGRKAFSRGLWAPAANIRQARADVEAQRADPAWQRRLDAGRRRRADEQADYVRDFEAEVVRFLGFHPRHEAVAADLAARVTALATPVGSGTVARTERIPVEQRAEAAVIAWMRHQTTAYDDMSVVRVKGARRELRRELAQRSRAVLQRYRRGDVPAADCVLAKALLAEPPSVAPASAPLPRPPAPPPSPPRAAPVAAPRAPAPRAPVAAPRAPVAAPRAPVAAPRAPVAPGAEPAPTAPLVAPRNAHEEAQQALYLKVRARLTRGK